MARAFICIVDRRIDKGRLEKAARTKSSDIFDWWNINKTARPGDMVLFYKLDPDQAFVATGVVASSVYRDKNKWNGDPIADIKDARMLTSPVARSEVARAFPDWGFPRRPGVQAVPQEIVAALLKLLETGKPFKLKQRLDTARSSEPMSGDKLYQQQARAAMPLLVRQAEAGTPLVYSELAAELGMPNPRNLNRVLGSIGQTLEALSAKWGEKIPPIQCLVINKQTGLPGEGIGWFLDKKDKFKALPLRRRREIVQGQLRLIYDYTRWREVLDALGLSPTKTDFKDLVAAASKHFGGGESERHKALKRYVAGDPRAIGLKFNGIGQVELPLPSGDCLDVSFMKGSLWVAVEVKSAISDEADLVRGMFQCVKYRAVMEAVLLTKKRPQNVRALLVLEGRLPESLVRLKNELGVEVIDGIVPKPASQ